MILFPVLLSMMIAQEPEHIGPPPRLDASIRASLEARRNAKPVRAVPAPADDASIRATVQARRERQQRRNRAAAIREAEGRELLRRDAIEADRQLKRNLEIGRVQAALGQAQAAQNQAVATQQQAMATASQADAIRQHARAVAGSGRNPYCANCGQYGHYACARGAPLFYNPYGLSTPPSIIP
jgi:hypothetical protein